MGDKSIRQTISDKINCLKGNNPDCILKIRKIIKWVRGYFCLYNQLVDLIAVI